MSGVMRMVIVREMSGSNALSVLSVKRRNGKNYPGVANSHREDGVLGVSLYVYHIHEQVTV